MSSLLVVDTTKRMTIGDALKHPWLDSSAAQYPHKDLLPKVSAGFDARKMFRKAVDVVKAINKLSASNLSRRASDAGSEFRASGNLLVADPNSIVNSSRASRNNSASNLFLQNK